jgi:16S rRNA processing protein RimM
MHPINPSSDSNSWVLIGRIRRAHALKGEVSVEPTGDNPSRFKKLSRVFLRNKLGEIREIKVLQARIANGLPLLMLEGIADKEAADGLKNQEILLPDSERPPLPKGHAYYDQIEGMEVIDDTTGETLGTVREVLDMPAGEVFVLDLNGTEHLVSNAGEEVISIDVPKKQLRVRLLEQY